MLAPMFDAISGGHHGGYERGMGRGPSRKLLEDINMRYNSEDIRNVQALNWEVGDIQAQVKHLKEQLTDNSRPTVEEMQPLPTIEDVFMFFRNVGILGPDNFCDAVRGLTHLNDIREEVEDQ